MLNLGFEINIISAVYIYIYILIYSQKALQRLVLRQHDADEARREGCGNTASRGPGQSPVWSWAASRGVIIEPVLEYVYSTPVHDLKEDRKTSVFVPENPPGFGRYRIPS